ncbi:MAG: hypothetical protein AAB963_00305, partial [Patescibacteria group bacterium]
MRVKAIYNQLLKKYGPQHWWPVYVRPGRTTPGRPVWFRDTQFEIAVGAILTQNTAWKNVAKAIENLYNAKALTPAQILKLPTQKLQSLIRPAGYFRQKAKKLKLFSKWLMKEFGGDILRLKRWEIGDMRDKLLKQWGVGPETADSIILYALNKPIFVIDEYTRRLCKKYGVVYNTYDEYQKFFESKLPRDTKLFQEFHALIVA